MENLMDVKIGNEILTLGEDEYKHLMTLGINFTDDWKETLIVAGEYNLLVNALFTMHKVDEAWEIISHYRDNIDFDYIFNNKKEIGECPYFQIKRDAQDIYKYMYDKNMIDDLSYAYFQILGGQLTDIDFWKSRFEGMSTSDKLADIHANYNGTNPFDVGLVVLTDETKDLIFGNMTPDEKIDSFIIGAQPGVFYDTKLLLSLIESNNLMVENYPKYFSILLSMIIEDTRDDEDSNAIEEMWNLAYTVCGDNIKDINLNDGEKMDSFIASGIPEKMYEDENERDIFKYMLVNSLAFMNYPYKYKNIFAERGINIVGLEIAKYLKPENYPYALSYKLLRYVDTSGLLIKYPFPGTYNCIYNCITNKIYLHGEVYDYTPDIINDKLSFVTGKAISDESMLIQDRIRSSCSSETEFDETIYSLRSFIESLSKCAE